MKGSIIVILIFCLGTALGCSGWLPAEISYSDCALWSLYLLVGIIGFEFGHKNLVPALKKITLEYFLLPLFTIIGTLTFSAVAWLLLRGFPLTDLLAIGSGMGYYSLAPILIMEEKRMTLGVDAAAEIGTIALMSNMVREIFALTCAPLFRKFFGWYGPISAAGIASIDVVLPAIVKNCGQEAIPVAIMQGVLLEITVPLLVTLFLSL